jgi:plastocyanin
MKRSMWLFWSVALLCLAGAACDDSPSGVENGQEIQLLSETFAPSTLTISAGTTVRWVNTRNTRHDVTPNNTAQAGVWTAFVLDTNGEARSYTFNTAGTFSYRCTLHSGMNGTITVTQ